jgi:hypothetical protein
LYRPPSDGRLQVITLGSLGYVPAMTAELEEKRARLATVERELCGLGIRHDLAMSAFKFDEAREVQQQIAVLERERGELVEGLPTSAVSPPRTVRRRRLMQRRCRPLRR